jgi:outer membrane immunogenic protein
MLRRILLASAGAMALAGPALAAEPLPPPPPPPPPPPMWTGFYAGLNAGGTWSSNNSINTAALPVTEELVPTDFTPLADVSAQLATNSVQVQNSGFIGGGQWGYNYQWNNWVLGAEGDFQGIASSNPTDTRFSQATAVVAGVALPTDQLLTASRRLDWLGTDRGRIGFLIWPTFLVYGTGGLAYGETRTSVAIGQTVVFPGFTSTIAFGSFNQTLAGWTAGGGVEWLFLPNWSLKVEYLYYDLGRVTFGLSPLTHSSLGVPVTVTDNLASTRFNGNIVRAGINYHFAWPAPTPVVAKY